MLLTHLSQSLLYSFMWEILQYFCLVFLLSWAEGWNIMYIFLISKRSFLFICFLSYCTFLTLSLVVHSQSRTCTLPTLFLFFLMLPSFRFHWAIHYREGVIEKLVLVWCIVCGIIHRYGFCAIKTAYRTRGHLSCGHVLLWTKMNRVLNTHSGKRDLQIGLGFPTPGFRWCKNKNCSPFPGRKIRFLVCNEHILLNLAQNWQVFCCSWYFHTKEASSFSCFSCIFHSSTLPLTLTFYSFPTLASLGTRPLFHF